MYDLRGGVVVKGIGNHRVHRQDDFFAGFGKQFPREIDLVLLEQRFADLQTHGLEKRVRHPAADEKRVHFRQEVVDHVDLPADLGPAHDCHKGPRRFFQRLAKVFELLFHQETRRVLLEMRRDAHSGRMRTVCGTERVIHVHVAQLCESGGKFRIIRLLLLVETKVFQQYDAAVFHSCNDSLRLLAYAVWRQFDRFTKDFRQPSRHRRQALLGIGLAFRASQMGHENEFSTPVDDPTDRFQSCVNPCFVGDVLVLVQGNVVVLAH
ncbi:MAG: hypothetical protein BWY06_02892 [Candidatus Latescibacteria bacterium ADurb.Bin168]|nr:MAG: hypothetical protein BWY06_02892 [Candidatus Latescibacteria bacterium ADurb.Bin168]